MHVCVWSCSTSHLRCVALTGVCKATSCGMTRERLYVVISVWRCSITVRCCLHMPGVCEARDDDDDDGDGEQRCAVGTLKTTSVSVQNAERRCAVCLCFNFGIGRGHSPTGPTETRRFSLPPRFPRPGGAARHAVRAARALGTPQRPPTGPRLLQAVGLRLNASKSEFVLEV